MFYMQLVQTGVSACSCFLLFLLMNIVKYSLKSNSVLFGHHPCNYLHYSYHKKTAFMPVAAVWEKMWGLGYDNIVKALSIAIGLRSIS